jgi:DNA-binding NarL/FixJ family response regulator
MIEPWDVHPTRLLLVDEHRSFAEGLASLLRDEPGFVVVGCLYSVEAALASASQVEADLVLLDEGVAEGLWLTSARLLRLCHPGAGVVLLASSDPRLLRPRAAAAGIGVVSKWERPSALVAALKAQS